MSGDGRTVTDATGLAAWVALGACVLALAPAGARWLRVAQREHYIPDSASRFALRWWSLEPMDLVLAAVALAGVVLSGLWPLAALGAAVAVAVGPLHLPVRGRSAPLVLTRRLKSLALVWLAMEGVVVGIGAAVGAPAPFAAAALVGAPAVVDIALLVMAPVERRLGARFVEMARTRLQRVAPTVVAITGSYGKTSTKNHVAQLVAGSRPVVATPASFNNRSGLARAINEHLAEGTEVFVAEMGTYGPGEIRDMCGWCPPEISVLTAIGPVHLERFGSEDAILTAKSEIAETASVVIVNADDRRLAALATALEARDRAPEVVRCSVVDEGADVCVRPSPSSLAIWIDGRLVAEGIPRNPGVQPVNLACAVAVARRVGVPPETVAARAPTLSAVANRLTTATSTSGVYVVDDTFNSNPAGARAALGALEDAPVDGRRVVVTPGMVELGTRQREENERFARDACEVATDLVVVGLTNRKALLAGAAGARPVITLRTRDEAVAWVRENLGPGDAVLYENDLPDQYP